MSLHGPILDGERVEFVEAAEKELWRFGRRGWDVEEEILHGERPSQFRDLVAVFVLFFVENVGHVFLRG